MQLELGVPNLSPLPEIARDAAGWSEFQRNLNTKLYLRKEGFRGTIGTPHVVSGDLLTRAQDLVSHFNRFYSILVQHYYQETSPRSEFLVNPSFAAEIEADRPTKRCLPACRFDCVLTPDGELKVIELNANAICLVHLRSVLYLARALHRGWSKPIAEQLDVFARSMVEAFTHHYRDEAASPAERPTVALVGPPGLGRGTRMILRGAFERFGWSSVQGSAADLAVSRDGMKLRGRPIDVLWADWLFYFAYQFDRYRETKFPSKMADYGSAPAATAAFFDDPVFVDLLRSKRVVLMSPMQSYLALSKHLLSWIHAEDRPLPGCDRAWLMRHTAKTYSARERMRGDISFDTAVKQKDGLLLKPCQYGGSHGVMSGRSVGAEEWSRKLESVWGELGWALQEFHAPVRARSGESISVGIHSYAGRFGGMTLRTAPSEVVNARDSAFIPVLTP